MNEVAEQLTEFYKVFTDRLNFAILIIYAILLFFFSWHYFFYIGNSFRKTKPIKLIAPKYKFAILVAARYESKVIKNLLDSLVAQNYPRDLFDVFVIVESKDDPTVEIVKSYNFQVVVRENLEGRRTKGYALDDAYQYIEKTGQKFDAFMIFDADNIVSKDYILTMNAIKDQGYEIGVGYRNFTNASKNWLTVTSGILFSFMNAFTSKGRTRLFNKASLTGTGYYVDYKIVHDAGGWIWNGMTEDVELTYYAYQNNIKMKYYSKIQYFDEQADKFSVMHKQHVRWTWGFMANKKKKFKNYKFNYHPEEKTRNIIARIECNVSIWPFLVFIILSVIAGIIDFGIGIHYVFFAPSLIAEAFSFMIFHFGLAYFAFSLIALFAIIIDQHNLKFSFKNIIKGIFAYPIFFLDFLFAFLDGLFNKKKKTDWKKIEHSGEIIDKEAKQEKVQNGEENTVLEEKTVKTKLKRKKKRIIRIKIR